MNTNIERTLSAQGLFKSYKGLQVVKGVDLNVSSNEIVGLLGPNGAGKTTTFYMVVGLVPHDSGTILLDDKDIGQLPMHKRAQHGIGYLPQEPSIFRNLSVQDNLMAILELRKDLNKQQRHDITDELLGEFNITHKREALGISLSGGERRRVEIARALATNPSFILLDEPFAGVDPISVGDIQRVIRHLKERGIGVLITDHNVRETLGICDRAYIVSEGRVLTKGHPDTILSHADVRAVYLGEDFRL